MVTAIVVYFLSWRHTHIGHMSPNSTNYTGVTPTLRHDSDYRNSRYGRRAGDIDSELAICGEFEECYISMTLLGQNVKF